MKKFSSKLGIIGVGKLGLPYALCFADAGIDVVASSYKKDYVEDLLSGNYQSTEPGVLELYKKLSNIKYTISNHEVIENTDMIYVLVATPSNPDGSYDVSAIWDVINDFRSYRGNLQDKILIIGSTVNPGDCVKFQSALEDRQIKVVYCPTFVAQGSVLTGIKDPRTLSIGTEDQETFLQCQDLFKKIIVGDAEIFQLHPTTGEILKLAGNCRATMQIAFFNLVGDILIRAGMQHDIDKANRYLNFIKEKPLWQFGFGYGGPCYPRDNRAFVEYSKKIGFDYMLGPVVDQSNNRHHQFLYEYFQSANIENLPYYFNHVSYKPNVAIFTESQQLIVAEKLLMAGHKVYIRPSEFLPEEMKTELKQRFLDKIEFVSIEDLEKQGIDVFIIGFEKRWKK